MAKIQVSTNVAIGGTSFAATVGTLGKGKGADKVRVIPATKNPSELITILHTAGYDLVVASQATGQTTVVKHFIATDRLVDSQNRRGGGRGR